jgi:hypothetical protein
MGDTKEGRERQARKAERRRWDREVTDALERLDEPEPPAPDDWPVCRYRNCDERALFRVVERYLEETSGKLVTAEALLCAAHTEEEAPTNLDRAAAEYVFRVEPIPGAFESVED